MSDHEELRCATIHAATRAALLEEGYPFPGAYCVDILRHDGETLRLNVATIHRVAAIVNDLRPRTFTLLCGRSEDAPALRDAISTLVNHHDTTMLH